MTRSEYRDYEDAVRDFFEREGIENLTGGHLRCPECDEDWDEEECPNGHSREVWDEPYFSWRPCDCCDTHLGGNREHATGYNREADEAREYQVCQDCIYYAKYGRLDDTTMASIESDAEDVDDD